MTHLTLKPLTPSDLEVFRSLLGSKEFGGCFCAVWTSYGPDWEKRCHDREQPNYFKTAHDVNQGRHAGFLVYERGDLVGWTGAGPKTAFPLLEKKLGSRLSPFTSNVWSIGCLAIAQEYRGRKLGSAIVAAVVEKAIQEGAIKVEAYPVRPFHEPRSYRGTVGIFERADFLEVAHDVDGEHQVVLMEKILSHAGGK